MAEFKTLTDEELDKVIGGVNWPSYAACLMAHGAAAEPALADLVKAIMAKDWAKVARLSANSPISSIPYVAECLASN